MRVKPKEVLLNLPVALLFNEPWEIPSFAASINTILHGKVRLKVEELGTLGGQYVGLFYLQRNGESQQIHDEFMRLIEEEQMNSTKTVEDYLPSTTITTTPNVDDKQEHIMCNDCDALMMLHRKGLTHCICGEDWINGKCSYPFDDWEPESYPEEDPNTV